MKLEKKVSIITGATSGIGRAISLAFAEEGAEVFATGRDVDRLEELKGKIKNANGACEVLPADLRRPGSNEEVVAEAVKQFGGVDILVNSAGIFELSDFFEIDEAFFDRNMEVNFKSVFFMCQKAATAMKKRGKGKIINMSSIAGGQIGVPTGSVYCAAKAAIAALTQCLSLELAPLNITVNAISPGNIRTPMNEHFLENPDYLQAMLDITPLKRIGNTGDITPLAVYLASEDSDYMTGQQLVIDGGVVCG
jgi:NAD(P)-dependent dehydrogenase (short-subunit alcohol dehydrogenase family)